MALSLRLYTKNLFRKEQMCDAAQALVMSVYEKAIQAILATNKISTRS